LQRPAIFGLFEIKMFIPFLPNNPFVN